MNTNHLTQRTRYRLADRQELRYTVTSLVGIVHLGPPAILPSYNVLLSVGCVTRL